MGGGQTKAQQPGWIFACGRAFRDQVLPQHSFAANPLLGSDCLEPVELVDDRTITDAGHAQQDPWPLVRTELPIDPFGGEAAAHHFGSEGFELVELTLQDKLTAFGILVEKRKAENREGAAVVMEMVTYLREAIKTVKSSEDAPALVQTLGNTVHESLLCGTPAVVQRAGGYISQIGEDDFQEEQRQGFLVDYEDVPAVAAAIEKAILLKMASSKPGAPKVGPQKRSKTTEGTDIVRQLLYESAGTATRNGSTSSLAMAPCSFVLSVLYPAYEFLAVLSN